MKLLLVLLIGLFITGCSCGRGEVGFHRGHVTDVSIAGLMCKTYEGQIMSGNGNSAVHYNFTIESKELYDKLLEAQANGKEVNVHYKSPVVVSSCTSANDLIVDGVTYVGEGQ
jgi:hypothetical protein